MMSKLILWIGVLSVSINVSAQNIEPREDTLLYFVEMDIRSRTNYPIIMNGVIKNPDFSRLSQRDSEHFLRSFYEQGYYVPEFLIYDDVIKECIRLTQNHLLERYKSQGQMLKNLISANGREKIIILDSGESVFIKVTKLTGRFLFFKREEIHLPSITTESGLNDIQEIHLIYVPLEINQYIKPSRRCIKEMFHNTPF